ncbi:MAG: prepilin-type N-terminal cleavage/methylation domain-containing protein [Kiritimatiellaeota bacterium]|nr:prepilin-type N-terminal cleavage/methylation domain-containing protein [Kiritimatiellota bacterium]
MNVQFRTKNEEQRTKNAELRTVSGLPAAFTLLEVMLVIGIVAILASLLYPVIIGARARAKEKQAAAETRTILMAIKAYHQEYGKWPAQIQATQDVTYVTNNWIVIQPLLGSNVTHPEDPSRHLNPKNKIFLNMQVNTNIIDYAGNYLDPWGIPYVICMDQNGDNSISLVWSNTPPMSYAANNTSGREIGDTNIYLTYRAVTNDAGVASLGGTASTLPWNSWTEMP